MTGSTHPRHPYDVQITRLAVVTADLLAKEMDDILLDLIHHAGTDRHPPHQAMAHAANRIVVRCRRLFEDIRLVRSPGEYAIPLFQQSGDDLQGERRHQRSPVTPRRHPPTGVAGFNRNQWPRSVGMVGVFARNRGAESLGIVIQPPGAKAAG